MSASEVPSGRTERVSKPSPASMRRLLLDTHVFLWWRADPGRIRTDVIDAISRADTVFVSVASAWEVGM